MKKAYELALLGLMTALCYIGFMFLRIDVSIGTGHTAFHLGNAFCLLAALFLGGTNGGIAGAIGMGVADITSGTYAIYTPKTFVMKLILGFICGSIYSVFGSVYEEANNTKKKIQWLYISTICAMLFNIIFEPIVSYFYSKYVLQLDSSTTKILTSWTAATTFVNAIIAVVVSVNAYLLLAKAIRFPQKQH